jgi:hypothetical protein
MYMALSVFQHHWLENLYSSFHLDESKLGGSRLLSGPNHNEIIKEIAQNHYIKGNPEFLTE